MSTIGRADRSEDDRGATVESSRNHAPVASPAMKSENVASPGVGARAGELVRTISDALTELVALPFNQISGHDRLAFAKDVEKQASRLGAIRDLVFGSINSDGLWRGKGARTMPDYVKRSTGASHREATKAVKRAEVLEEKLPAFRQAFAAGELNAEKIDTINRYVKTPELEAKLRDPRRGENYLLSLAKSTNADVFRKRMKAWSIEHAPGAAEAEAKALARAENVSLVPDEDGWRISGWFTSLNGEILNTALTAVMGAPTQGDPATPPERRARALVEVARRLLDGGSENSAAVVRPHISVHVPVATLEAIAPLNEVDLPSEEGFSSEEDPSSVYGEHSGKSPAPFRAGGQQGSCMDGIVARRKRLGEILSVIRPARRMICSADHRPQP